jgi:hypothetical protein
MLPPESGTTCDRIVGHGGTLMRFVSVMSVVREFSRAGHERDTFAPIFELVAPWRALISEWV